MAATNPFAGQRPPRLRRALLSDGTPTEGMRQALNRAAKRHTSPARRHRVVGPGPKTHPRTGRNLIRTLVLEVLRHHTADWITAREIEAVLSVGLHRDDLPQRIREALGRLAETGNVIKRGTRGPGVAYRFAKNHVARAWGVEPLQDNGYPANKSPNSEAGSPDSSHLSSPDKGYSNSGVRPIVRLTGAIQTQEFASRVATLENRGPDGPYGPAGPPDKVNPQPPATPGPDATPDERRAYVDYLRSLREVAR